MIRTTRRRAKEELLISLKEAVTDIIELRRQQARREMTNDYEEVLLAISKEVN
ncbi:hypothetical protein [Geminocystis herdmanii]|uniref:hypothetical protein n=1 Tax=Geminocystis herdmanii TaxID=669359 RepID=UPI000348969B|nr:hypothetical protein [Geminocystis herdmanii]